MNYLYSRATRIGLVATFGTTVSVAQADELLLIDLSVTDQITITATDGLSAASVSGLDAIGMYLDGFYNLPSLGNVLSSSTTILDSGDLTNVGNASDGTPSLFRGFTNGDWDPGMNIFGWSSDDVVTFTAGSQAFTGSATWALDSADYADMVAGNTAGDIYFTADRNRDLDQAEILGTYRVVPTPGTLALVGVCGGIGALRRRR